MSGQQNSLWPLALNSREVVALRTNTVELLLGLGSSAGNILKHIGQDSPDSVLSASLRLEKKFSVLGPAGPTDNVLVHRFTIAALVKAGFDPDQPRDWHGRWASESGPGPAGTNGGRGSSRSPGDENSPSADHNGPSNASSADARATDHNAPTGADTVTPGIVPAATLTATGAPTLLDSMVPDVVAGLGEIAAGISAAAAAFLGIVFIPTNRSLISSGTLPDRPDVTYHYDAGAGVLTLYQNGQEIFSGHSDPDGVFRDPNGDAFGRRVATSLVLDPDAPLYNSTSDTHDNTRDRAGTRSATDRTTDKPKLCPDPTEENIVGRSERALAYQEQVTGLHRGLAVKLNGVSFDGCDDNTGAMSDAKGQGYLWAMDGPDGWKDFYRGADQMMRQIQRQVLAAPDRQIIWYFAEQQVANFFREAFADYHNVTVIYEPYRPGGKR